MYYEILNVYKLKLNLHKNGQEKEYREAMELFQEKNNERAQLTTTLVEVFIYILHTLPVESGTFYLHL